MLKRRFYKLEHGDKAALDSSSSSDSEIEAEATDTEESEDEALPEVKQDDDDADSISSGLLFSEDDGGTINDISKLKNRELSSKHDSEVLEGKSKFLTDENKSLSPDMPSIVLKIKSVFKCRICPRIVCLTEQTLRDHLQSKRHARSEKLLGEGRLKAILNCDGEIENLVVSESEAEDTEDNAEKKHIGQKQNKKKFKKKKSDNVNTRKMKSTKGSKKSRKNES